MTECDWGVFVCFGNMKAVTLVKIRWTQMQEKAGRKRNGGSFSDDFRSFRVTAKHDDRRTQWNQRIRETHRWPDNDWTWIQTKLMRGWGAGAVSRWRNTAESNEWINTRKELRRHTENRAGLTKEMQCRRGGKAKRKKTLKVKLWWQNRDLLLNNVLFFIFTINAYYYFLPHYLSPSGFFSDLLDSLLFFDHWSK